MQKSRHWEPLFLLLLACLLAYTRLFSGGKLRPLSKESLHHKGKRNLAGKMCRQLPIDWLTERAARSSIRRSLAGSLSQSVSQCLPSSFFLFIPLHSTYLECSQYKKSRMELCWWWWGRRQSIDIAGAALPLILLLLCFVASSPSSLLFFSVFSAEHREYSWRWHTHVAQWGPFLQDLFCCFCFCYCRSELLLMCQNETQVLVRKIEQASTLLHIVIKDCPMTSEWEGARYFVIRLTSR